ncbi:hypothetical protein AB1286_20695 [Trinickia sp. NRRL B-1857]|uniref:hypothetical protein n=1 Tax=Trinickia sp. NRRL B-1857 TaxID=3162879 RepID=UPI003D29A2FA
MKNDTPSGSTTLADVCASQPCGDKPNHSMSAPAVTAQYLYRTSKPISIQIAVASHARRPRERGAQARIARLMP